MNLTTGIIFFCSSFVILGFAAVKNNLKADYLFGTFSGSFLAGLIGIMPSDNLPATYLLATLSVFAGWLLGRVIYINIIKKDQN